MIELIFYLFNYTASIFSLLITIVPACIFILTITLTNLDNVLKYGRIHYLKLFIYDNRYFTFLFSCRHKDKLIVWNATCDEFSTNTNNGSPQNISNSISGIYNNLLIDDNMGMYCTFCGQRNKLLLWI